MSSREQLREEYDIPIGERRYTSGEHTPLEEIADPTTRQDESSQSVREWAGENRVLAIVLSVLGFVGVLAVGYLIYQHAPGVLMNPWVHRGAAATALFAGGAVVASRSTLATLKRYDWLVLMRSKWDTPKLYLGHYADARENRRPLFVPVKGVGLLGGRDDAYTIGELSDELAQRRENANKSPEHPAVIRLNPGFGGDTSTWFGTVFVQLSSGLELDPFGKDSTLRAAPPSMADESALDSFEAELEQQRNTISNLKSEKARAEEQKKDALAEARKSREEHITEFVKRHGLLMQLGRSQRSRSGTESSVPEEELDFSDIEAELEADADE